MDYLANDILKYYLLPFLNIPDRKAFKLINNNFYEIERKAEDNNIYRYRYKLAKNKKVAVKYPYLARGRCICTLLNVPIFPIIVPQYEKNKHINHVVLDNSENHNMYEINDALLITLHLLKNVNQITIDYYDINDIMELNIPEELEILNISYDYKDENEIINKPYAFKKNQKLKAFNIVKYAINGRDREKLPIIKYSGTFKHIDKDIYTVTFYNFSRHL